MRSATLSCFFFGLLFLPSPMQAQSPELSKTVQEFVPRTCSQKLFLLTSGLLTAPEARQSKIRTSSLRQERLPGIQKGSDVDRDPRA